MSKITDDTKFLIQIIVSLLTLAGVGSLLQNVVNPVHSKRQVILGMTNYSQSNADKLKHQLDSVMIVPAIRILGPLASRYQYEIKVIGIQYDELLVALNGNTVDLAIVSPYTYIYNYYLNKFDLTKGKQSPFSNFTTVGRKYLDGKAWYYPGFLKFHADKTIRSVSDVFDKSRVTSLVLGAEQRSTSTSVVPRIFLQHGGRNDLLIHAQQESRKDFIESVEGSVRDDSNYFVKGQIIAFSDEDWETFKNEKEKLSYRFDFMSLKSIPIPYDPILVKKSNWKERVSNDYEELANSFRSALIFYPEPNDTEWVHSNHGFVEYIASGADTDMNKQNSKDSKHRLAFSPVAEFALAFGNGGTSWPARLCKRVNHLDSLRPNYESIYPFSLDSVSGGKVAKDSVGYYLTGVTIDCDSLRKLFVLLAK